MEGITGSRECVIAVPIPVRLNSRTAQGAHVPVCILNSPGPGASDEEGTVAPTEADDQELVAACKTGDRRAFRTLVQRYERKVYAVAYGFLRNQEDALDVVQEAFVKVHRYLHNFEGQSSFYTWLYRIVANLCIDHMRRNKRKHDVEFDDGLRHDGEADPGGSGLLPAAGFADPGRALGNKEILQAVRAGLDELSDKHRAVIVMRELQGMSYADMAKAMGCSKGTIMSRLFHARKNMQKILTARLHLDPDSADSGEGNPQSAGLPASEALAP